MDPDGRYRDRPARSLAEWRDFPCRFVYDPSKAVLVTRKYKIKTKEKHKAFRGSLMTAKSSEMPADSCSTAVNFTKRMKKRARNVQIQDKP